MKRKITRAVINALGGEELFDKAVAQYSAALEAHAGTEGVPAPAANPLIADLVANYDGYEVEEPIDTSPKLSVADQALQDIEMLKVNYSAMQHQMLEMGVAVKEARELAGYANGEVRRLSEVVLELQNQMSAVLAADDGTTAE